MERTIISLLAVLMTGCAESRSGPYGEMSLNAYQSWKDRFVAGTGVALPGIPAPCLRDVERNGEAFRDWLPTDKCVQMLPQQRWRGLYGTDFELMRFCPPPATECSNATPGEEIWVTFTEDLSVPPNAAEHTGLSAIEFIGRRTRYPGHFGHLNSFEHEIYFDRILSMKPVGKAKGQTLARAHAIE